MPTPPADSLPSLPPVPLADGPSLGSAVASSLVSLGAICLLAFVAFWAMRWFNRRSGALQPDVGPLRVLARQSLDPKRSVFVIEAAERCFLVGAGEGSMSLLAELDRAVVARDLARVAARPNPAGRLFADVLGKVMRRPPLPTSPEREEADHAAQS